MSQALARGIESQGAQVDTFDGARDPNVKLTIYQYVALGAEPAGTFGGKIPDTVKPFLAAAGSVAGRRCYAFVPSSRFGAEKSLAALMAGMEAEGMMLRSSSVFRSAVEAEETGRRLKID
jgi:hypothetical protein